MRRRGRREPDVRPARGRRSRRTRVVGRALAGEFVATFGLLLVILGVVRAGRASVAPFAVGGYIAAAYWFTSSTSFANPAVTIGRTLTDTFAGIAPSSVPVFVAHAARRRARRGRARAVTGIPTSPPTDIVVPRRIEPARDRDRATIPRCCSSACTTPGAARWRSAGSTTSRTAAPSACSGGSEPADQVNPVAVAAMAEVGIDIATSIPKRWTDEALDAADVVVTMGCGDTCPFVPGHALRGLAARRPGRPATSTRCARSATRSATASARCSPTSASGAFGVSRPPMRWSADARARRSIQRRRPVGLFHAEVGGAGEGTGASPGELDRQVVSRIVSSRAQRA